MGAPAAVVDHLDRQKTLNRAALLRALLALAITWGLPLIWLGMSPPLFLINNWLGIDGGRRFAIRTESRLHTAQKLINDYIAANKAVPLSLGRLRLFAASEGKVLPTYDAFGQRLAFLRLDDTHYLLRSFGRDGIQNSMLTQGDINTGRLSQRPMHGLTFKYAPLPELDFYPAVFVAGAESPSRLWHARLHVDRQQGTRRLVASHATKKDLVMVAEHDGIEEFLWLPNGYQIVYTATGSDRYRDGLYLWNLLDDSTTDLTALVAEADAAGSHARTFTSGTPGSQSGKLNLSLAGISMNGPTIYARRSPRISGAALDPFIFYGKSSLIALRIPEKKGAPQVIDATMEIQGDAQLLAKPLNLASHVEGYSKNSEGLKVQQAWLKLQLQGDMEKVLLAWQSFSEKEANSPLLPYSLWYLSALYGNSFWAMSEGGKPGSSDAQILRTYGTELARALADFALAPSYLRGLALYSYDHLMVGQPLPYLFVQLTQAKAGLVAPSIEPVLEDAKNIPPPVQNAAKILDQSGLHSAKEQERLQEKEAAAPSPRALPKSTPKFYEPPMPQKNESKKP